MKLSTLTDFGLTQKPIHVEYPTPEERAPGKGQKFSSLPTAVPFDLRQPSLAWRRSTLTCDVAVKW